MLKWYFLFSAIDGIWVPATVFTVLLLYIGIIFILKMISSKQYESELIEEVEKKLKNPILYIGLGICALCIVFWPSKVKLIEAYTISEVLTYFKNNPEATLNPQSLLSTVNELIEVLNTGLNKLSQLLK